jgi:hypothetical protein
MLLPSVMTATISIFILFKTNSPYQNNILYQLYAEVSAATATQSQRKQSHCMILSLQECFNSFWCLIFIFKCHLLKSISYLVLLSLFIYGWNKNFVLFLFKNVTFPLQILLLVLIQPVTLYVMPSISF